MTKEETKGRGDVLFSSVCRLILKTVGRMEECRGWAWRLVGFQARSPPLFGLADFKHDWGFLEDKRIQGPGLDLSQK